MNRKCDTRDVTFHNYFVNYNIWYPLVTKNQCHNICSDIDPITEISKSPAIWCLIEGICYSILIPDDSKEIIESKLSDTDCGIESLHFLVSDIWSATCLFDAYQVTN